MLSESSCESGETDGKKRARGRNKLRDRFRARRERCSFNLAAKCCTSKAAKAIVSFTNVSTSIKLKSEWRRKKKKQMKYNKNRKAEEWWGIRSVQRGDPNSSGVWVTYSISWVTGTNDDFAAPDADNVATLKLLISASWRANGKNSTNQKKKMKQNK